MNMMHMDMSGAPLDPAPPENNEDSPRGELAIGGIMAGVFFLGFLGWAALIPLDAGAMAQGTVMVSGNRQAVQHHQGGILTKLSVSEGQTVKKGQALLEISSAAVIAEERSLSGEVIALLALRARLLAERDNLRGVEAPAEFRVLSGQDRNLADDALQGQRLLFDARRASVETQRSVLQQQIGQHREQIGGVRSQIASNRKQKELIQAELDGMTSLIDRGFVSMNRVRAIQRTSAQLDGDNGSFHADVARSSQAIGETRMQMLAIDRNWTEEVATELRTTQVRLAELQPRLAAAKENLRRSVVRAPAAGRIVGLKVFTEGGVVGPGEMMMEIVPQDRALVIDAKVAPSDADDLYRGMQTQVRFTALQERNLPILQGEITKVSADSFEDDRSGSHYFKIEVVVPPEEIAKIAQVRGDTGLRAGLPAEVMIPLRKRSALSYLVEPLSQTLWRVGREN